MEILIKEYTKYNEEEILNLYNSVGWVNYTNNLQMLKGAYENSLKIMGAYENEKLLGIIRVVGDEHSVIFIQDLLVYPEYQRCGIGSALLKQVLQDYKHVYQKHLITEYSEKTIQFYKSLGFSMDRDIGCTAFSIYY